MKTIRKLFLISGFLVLTFQIMQLLGTSTLVSRVFAQRDAIMTHFSVEALPPVQGVGGTIEIKASIGFAASCCEGAMAYDVTVVLVIPKNLELTEGEQQQVVPIVVCDAPGKRVFIEFAWSVGAVQKGNYTAEVQMTSRNAGGANKSCLLQFDERPPISSPIVNPKMPSINDDIEIGVIVASPDINEVLLNYSINGGVWKSIVTDEVAGDYRFALIEKQQEGVLTFCFETMTIHNETFRSPMYELKIIDFVRLDLWNNISLASYFALVITGSVSIFIMGRKIRRRRETSPKHAPPILRDYDELDYERPELAEQVEVKPGMKYKPAIILITFSVALLVIAVLLNEFGQLMPHLQGLPP